jgi:hypothetical protein
MVELLQRYSKLANLSKIGQYDRSRSVPVVRPQVHALKRRLRPEDITQLVADYQAGSSSTALMKKYQLGKGTILGILREAGVIRQQRKLSKTQLDETAALYSQGWSLVRIGERLDFVLVDTGKSGSGHSQRHELPLASPGAASKLGDRNLQLRRPVESA